MARRKNVEDIVEESTDKVDGRFRPRVTIPITEEGKLDFSNMKAPSRERLTKALQEDPTAFGSFGAGTTGTDIVSTKDGPVTPDHINILLSFYEQAERFAIPKFLSKTTDKATGIPVIIPSNIAERAFVFSVETRTRLCPPGATFLNQTLPPWLLKFIAKGGPGAEFIGGLLVATYMQTQAAIEMWRTTVPLQAAPVTQPVNGMSAGEAVAAGVAGAAPEQ